MRHVSSSVVSAVAIVAALLVGWPARAGDDGLFGQDNRYVVTNLTSDLPGFPPKNPAKNTDPVLQNAWGVAFSPAGSPFWISDNATGCSTLYDGEGVPQPVTPQPLRVKLPLPGGSVPPTACMHNDPKSPLNPTPAAPTGQVWNPAAAFVVPDTTTPASFIFDTEDGTISAWAGGLTPPNQAVLAVDNSSAGAVYKGLAFGVSKEHGALLFATNFHDGTVDVFGPPNASSKPLYAPVTTSGGFVDHQIPPGYAPFGIQNIDGNLFVTYAKQGADKKDDAAGPGRGFVDVFDTDGNLLRRFASRGALNSPWGVARASFAFGKFSDQILIGNFGDGRINVFSSRGDFLGTLRDAKDKPIAIDGLWTLTLGGGRNSSPSTLYFTAGPNDETDGLFGKITPASGHK